MRVGWLCDDPGYLGGAELTMREFKAAAPEGVEVIDCPPGGIVGGLDRYMVGNCMTYSGSEILWARTVRYHHDVARAPADDYLDFSAQHIFCSPMQQEYMGMEGQCIPPALDLDRFKAVANQNHRKGAVCIGRMAYGKGTELLAEYEEPVDVYSSVPIRSEGALHFKGALQPNEVPAVLASYERFIFLPTALEPFGRAVVEAWAAGLQIVVNKNVGCRYWIEEEPEALESAGERFWGLVRDAH